MSYDILILRALDPGGKHSSQRGSRTFHGGGRKRSRMSTAELTTQPSRPGISFFERYLTIWVALCIVAGIALGSPEGRMVYEPDHPMADAEGAPSS